MKDYCVKSLLLLSLLVFLEHCSGQEFGQQQQQQQLNSNPTDASLYPYLQDDSHVDQVIVIKFTLK